MDKPEEQLKVLKEMAGKLSSGRSCLMRMAVLIPQLRALTLEGNRRISANPHANGGLLLRDLRLPDFRDYGIEVPAPGSVESQDMINLGSFVRGYFQIK